MMCASTIPPFSRRYSGLFHFTAHVQKLLRKAAPKQTEWRRVQTTCEAKLSQRGQKTEQAGGKQEGCGKTTKRDDLFHGGHY